MFDNGGLIYAENALGVTSTANTFQNCYAADSGGIFWVKSTTLTSTNTQYICN